MAGDNVTVRLAFQVVILPLLAVLIRYLRPTFRQNVYFAYVMRYGRILPLFWSIFWNSSVADAADGIPLSVSLIGINLFHCAVMVESYTDIVCFSVFAIGSVIVRALLLCARATLPVDIAEKTYLLLFVSILALLVSVTIIPNVHRLRREGYAVAAVEQVEEEARRCRELVNMRRAEEEQKAFALQSTLRAASRLRTRRLGGKRARNKARRRREAMKKRPRGSPANSGSVLGSIEEISSSATADSIAELELAVASTGDILVNTELLKTLRRKSASPAARPLTLVLGTLAALLAISAPVLLGDAVLRLGHSAAVQTALVSGLHLLTSPALGVIAAVPSYLLVRYRARVDKFFHLDVTGDFVDDVFTVDGVYRKRHDEGERHKRRVWTIEMFATGMNACIVPLIAVATLAQGIQRNKDRVKTTVVFLHACLTPWLHWVHRGRAAAARKHGPDLHRLTKRAIAACHGAALLLYKLEEDALSSTILIFHFDCLVMACAELFYDRPPYTPGEEREYLVQTMCLWACACVATRDPPVLAACLLIGTFVYVLLILPRTVHRRRQLRRKAPEDGGCARCADFRVLANMTVATAFMHGLTFFLGGRRAEDVGKGGFYDAAFLGFSHVLMFNSYVFSDSFAQQLGVTLWLGTMNLLTVDFDAMKSAWVGLFVLVSVLAKHSKAMGLRMLQEGLKQQVAAIREARARAKIADQAKELAVKQITEARIRHELRVERAKPLWTIHREDIIFQLVPPTRAADDRSHEVEVVENGRGPPVVVVGGKSDDATAHDNDASSTTASTPSSVGSPSSVVDRKNEREEKSGQVAPPVGWRQKQEERLKKEQKNAEERQQKDEEERERQRRKERQEQQQRQRRKEQRPKSVQDDRRVVLGKGGFGTVFLGFWGGTRAAIKKVKFKRRRKRTRNPLLAVRDREVEECLGGAAAVAAAAAKPKLTKSQRKRERRRERRRTKDILRHEMQTLARIRHPNICLFLGADITSGKNPLLVTEYCERGSMWHVLHESDEPLPWALRIAMATDAATALWFLHSNGLIHADVKTPNLLVTGSWQVKVSDFGLSFWAGSHPLDRPVLEDADDLLLSLLSAPKSIIGESKQDSSPDSLSPPDEVGPDPKKTTKKKGDKSAKSNAGGDGESGGEGDGNKSTTSTSSSPSSSTLDSSGSSGLLSMARPEEGPPPSSEVLTDSSDLLMLSGKAVFGDDSAARKRKKAKASKIKIFGTLHWAAPELFWGHEPSKQTDAFAFGICLWELLTRKRPYGDMQDPKAIRRAVLAGLRPATLAGTREMTADDPAPARLLQALSRACCEAHASKRTNLQVVLLALRRQEDGDMGPEALSPPSRPSAKKRQRGKTVPRADHDTLDALLASLSIGQARRGAQQRHASSSSASSAGRTRRRRDESFHRHRNFGRQGDFSDDDDTESSGSSGEEDGDSRTTGGSSGMLSSARSSHSKKN